MSFLQKVTLERTFSIYLLSNCNGIKFYAYILVPSAKTEAFEKALDGQVHRMVEFGFIIDFFIGKAEPDVSMRDDVRRFIELYNNEG